MGTHIFPIPLTKRCCRWGPCKWASRSVRGPRPQSELVKSVSAASLLQRGCRSGKLPRKVGCSSEHCSLCFLCYLQNPPLSTEREIKRVFIRVQDPLATVLQPEPRQTQWLIEHGSPSACTQHTTLEPSDPQKCTDIHLRPEQQLRAKVAGAAQVTSATMISSFKHMGHWEFSIFLFLPKAQQFETIIANFPSCEMRCALFLTCCSQTEVGWGRCK